MATTFSLTSSLRVTPRWVDSLDQIDVVDTASASVSYELANGTGVGQANGYWKGLVTFAPPNGEATLDLRALSLSVFGGIGTLSLASVKALLIRNLSSTATITIGGSVADRWAGRSSGTETIGPSGVLYSVNATGWATSASSKVLHLLASQPAATCEVYIAGVKAT